MIKFLALLIILSFLSFSYSDEIETAKELLRLQGLSEMSEMFWQKQIDDARESDYPKLNDTVWIKVKNDLNQKDAFLNEIAKLYVDYFTDSELKELLTIIKSNTFQKYMWISKKVQEISLEWLPCL